MEPGRHTNESVLSDTTERGAPCPPSSSDRVVQGLFTWTVDGWLRFLSHAELMRFFERACRRAGLPMRYTQGFNPHPRLSLPLPKPVAVVSSGDLLCLDLEAPGWADDAVQPWNGWKQDLLERLVSQCPPGVAIDGVRLVHGRGRIQPVGVRYELTLHDRTDRARLARRIQAILDSDEWFVDRNRPGGGGRKIEARSLIEAIEAEGSAVRMEVAVREGRTLRVDEIMTLLELVDENLAGPIRRCDIRWRWPGSWSELGSTRHGDNTCQEK